MITLEDGAYTIEVALTGGSGRADVDSPAHLTVNQGQMQAQIVWSSPYYDYMEVDGRGMLRSMKKGIPCSALQCLRWMKRLLCLRKPWP